MVALSETTELIEMHDVLTKKGLVEKGDADSFNQTLAPKHAFWDKHASAVHGMTMETNRGKPDNVAECLKSFYEWIEQRVKLWSPGALQWSVLSDGPWHENIPSHLENSPSHLENIPSHLETFPHT